VLEFVRDLIRQDPAFTAAEAPAGRLDRYYIPARYPNGLPGGTPFQSYTAEDLATALRDVEAIFAAAEPFLRGRGVLG
jgi:HEPN domain-containing protein